MDAVSAYLLGKSYDALDEGSVKHGKDETNAARKELAGPMSASEMVDTFVAVGRFWYSPSWAFKRVEAWDAWWSADAEVTVSLARVDEFVAQVTSDAESAIKEDASSHTTSKPSTPTHPLTSYPSRLLQAGISPSETRAQCKDLIFAGSDSTGMNLATILCLLARHPSAYTALRAELLSHNPEFDDLQSLPYLRGVVKEGLRLSMANPSRLPRVVPPGGWTFKSTFFPAGTEISCTPYSLHLNPDIFPDPHAFKLERWLNPSEEMIRDAIPFGLGSRQYIARNLATVELFVAVARTVQKDVLKGVRAVRERIEILEWLNSKVVGGRVDLTWER